MSPPTHLPTHPLTHSQVSQAMWNFEGVADVQEAACAFIAHLAEISIRARAPLMGLLPSIKRALAVHTRDASVQAVGLGAIRVLSTDATSRVRTLIGGQGRCAAAQRLRCVLRHFNGDGGEWLREGISSRLCALCHNPMLRARAPHYHSHSTTHSTAHSRTPLPSFDTHPSSPSQVDLMDAVGLAQSALVIHPEEPRVQVCICPVLFHRCSHLATSAGCPGGAVYVCLCLCVCVCVFVCAWLSWTLHRNVFY